MNILIGIASLLLSVFLLVNAKDLYEINKGAAILDLSASIVFLIISYWSVLS